MHQFLFLINSILSALDSLKKASTENIFEFFKENNSVSALKSIDSLKFGLDSLLLSDFLDKENDHYVISSNAPLEFTFEEAVSIHNKRKGYLFDTVDSKFLNTKIIRIFKKNHFINTIKNFQNTLVNPGYWDDKFEFNKKDYMGQCWSLNDEYEFDYWNVYNKNNGIVIKSTVKKIYDSIFDCKDLIPWIGKVNYNLPHQSIESLQEDIIFGMFKSSSEAQAYVTHTFLNKTSDWIDENEIRILISNVRSEDGLFLYKINPNKMIEEIIFDPSMESKKVDKCISSLEDFGAEFKMTYNPGMKFRKSIKLPNSSQMPKSETIRKHRSRNSYKD